jgi:hypothetical protein
MARPILPALERLSQELRRQNESVDASIEQLAGQLTVACPRGNLAWRKVLAGGEILHGARLRKRASSRPTT